jgi:aminoglycoside 3-N-acetyltransferase I
MSDDEKHAKPPMTAVRRLQAGDADGYAGMLRVFAGAFEDDETYLERMPGADYRNRLLSDDRFIALVVERGSEVVGALAGYELQKFEQERSEFYIYDLAVDARHRREGIAVALIEELKAIAKARGGFVIFVQADYGDDAAIALYTKMGKREEVLHFDILPDERSS